ncbi:TolC family protein [Robiginitalea sp. SC105]|uniref:TolC family protein n=1 Tax=Robiginitalea sp. SC105 TaxID=2762332 RepID=UPI00163B1528|nr:TolC family protein [Robiginitalea sp. SC105]MBC2838424.1 TolC family protein [Robiginitalea sp. SC105]
MRFIRIGILTLFLVQQGYSQQTETPVAFSLEEAVAYALEHNYSAINADRDLVDAEKQKWETIASGLPQISGAVSYQDQIKQPVSLVPAEFFGGQPGDFEPVVFGPPRTTSATATLKQQIFDGSYIVGIQATKAFLSYSRNNQEKTEQEVRRAVVESYGNTLLARQSVDLLEKDIEAVDKNLYETEKLYENGLAEEEEVEQLQITSANLHNSLSSNRRLQEITLQMLNITMGLPLDHPTELTQNLDELVAQETRPELLDSEFVMENNVDYKLVQNLNEQRFYELKLARSRALPTLNAFINYGRTGFSDPFSYFESGTQSFESSILGFDLSIPIFSSLGRSASTQRAKIALEKAKTELKETEQKLELQLDQARNAYTLAIETYETSKANLALAERIERKNTIKYSEGIASSFDLRQAQTQLYTAQREYLQSMVDVINRKTALENILNP